MYQQAQQQPPAPKKRLPAPPAPEPRRRLPRPGTSWSKANVAVALGIICGFLFLAAFFRLVSGG